MKIYNYISEAMASLNCYSKRVLKFGGIYLLAVVTAAIGFYISAGYLMNYYSAIFISSQLVSCLNPCVGVIGLGVILFECSSAVGSSAD